MESLTSWQDTEGVCVCVNDRKSVSTNEGRATGGETIRQRLDCGPASIFSLPTSVEVLNDVHLPAMTHL